MLSLVFWSLILVVSVKYVDLHHARRQQGRGRHHGADGAGAAQRERLGRARAGCIVVLGLFGAALFFGDGVITPAISVLGAVEGLEVAAPALAHCVVPIALVILLGLFCVAAPRHRHRSARCSGRSCWCGSSCWPCSACASIIAASAACCTRSIPCYAVQFFVHHGRHRVLRARRASCWRHRRRGAVCRHGPFRQEADPHGVVRSSCCRRWCSTISARARCCCTIRRRSRIRST